MRAIRRTRMILCGAAFAALANGCSRSALYLDGAAAGGDGGTGVAGSGGVEGGIADGGEAGLGGSAGMGAGGGGAAGAGAGGGAGIGGDGGTNAADAGDAACNGPGVGCAWYDCVSECTSQASDAIYYTMLWRLNECACKHLCTQYCQSDGIDQCGGTGILYSDCFACEVVALTHDECVGIPHDGLCNGPACDAFTDCLLGCGAPPPSAALPGGGTCVVEEGDGGVSVSWTDLGADGGCCPAAQPVAGAPCTARGTCVYGTNRCVCDDLAHWKCQ